MYIQHNIQLQSFNTLALDAVTSHYAVIQNSADVVEALEYAAQHQLNVMILSGGSNILLPGHIHALVIHMDIQGIEQIAADEQTTTVKVGAGQNWHDFVLWSTQQHYYGLQNLALIPGRVGASPVQNIGAYGVEVGEFIEDVYVYDREEKVFKVLSSSACHFSYRHSLFKEHPNRYIITHVSFKLLKQPILKINYGDLKTAMADDLTPENLQQQVIHIRQSKLPSPQEYPNVGSFFKNPVITQAAFDFISQKFTHLPHYVQPNEQVKIAAGWLIDQAEWKGKRLGKVGMFHKQALVLVNYENAQLHDVRLTYRAVQKDVFEKFNILLEPEPVLFNNHGLIQSHQED